MGRWQRKILFSLIVYFAGFGTAIYFLAPATPQASRATDPGPSEPMCRAGLSGEDLAQLKETARAGLAKFEVFAEEQTARAAAYFKERLAERQADGG